MSLRAHAVSRRAFRARFVIPIFTAIRKGDTIIIYNIILLCYSAASPGCNNLSAAYCNLQFAVVAPRQWAGEKPLSKHSHARRRLARAKNISTGWYDPSSRIPVPVPRLHLHNVIQCAHKIVTDSPPAVRDFYPAHTCCNIVIRPNPAE